MASKNSTTSAPSGPVRLDPEVFAIRKYGKRAGLEKRRNDLVEKTKRGGVSAEQLADWTDEIKRIDAELAALTPATNVIWAISGPQDAIVKMFRTSAQYVITTSKGRDMLLTPTGSVVVRKVDGAYVRVWLGDDKATPTAAMAYDRVKRGKTTSAPTFDESAFD